MKVVICYDYIFSTQGKKITHNMHTHRQSDEGEDIIFDLNNMSNI